MNVKVKSSSLKGLQALTILIGSYVNPCITVTCQINDHCSTDYETCLYNIPMLANCYSSQTGGSINLILLQPPYTSSSVESCPSQQGDVLLVIQFDLSSDTSPTPAPTMHQGALQSQYFLGIKGAPFYAMATVVMCCILLGVVLLRQRDANDTNITELNFTTVCFQLGLFGFNITSEFAYIIGVYRSSYSNIDGFATVIVIARLLHLPGAFFILTKLFENESNTNSIISSYIDNIVIYLFDTSSSSSSSSPSSSLSRNYMDLVDKEHILRNRNIHVFLFLSIFLDNTNVAYLPWLSSKFTGISDGIPDLLIYKLVYSVKLIQSSLSSLMQIIVLGKLNSTHNFKYLSTNTQVFIVISILSSLIVIIVTLTGIYLQYSLIRTLVNNDNNSNDNNNDDRLSEVNNPMTIRIDDRNIQMTNSHNNNDINEKMRLLSSSLSSSLSSIKNDITNHDTAISALSIEMGILKQQLNDLTNKK